MRRARTLKHCGPCISRRVFLAAAAAIILPIGARGASAQDDVDADLLLIGGTIVDGTGGVPYQGNVAVRGERIVAVGDFTAGEIKRRIDCQGMIVAPGFIDLHNHSDRPILREETRTAINYLTQGCTTIVTGNCGGGHVNVADYLAKLEEKPPGVNVAHLLPHGSLRSRVVSGGRRPPTEEELDQMRTLARKAMQDGAWGMSTGLIYVPGAYAQTDELVEIAKVVGTFGGIYASHIRGESKTLLTAVEEALEIGSRAELPVHISHFKVMGRPYWGSVHVAAKRIEEAQAAGQRVTADQYPYIASSTSLAAMVLPSELREGGSDALAKRVRDEKLLPELHREIEQSLGLRDRIQIASFSKNRKWEGKLLADIAEAEKRSEVDIVVEILAEGGASAVNFGMSEDDVRRVMQLPWVATASDGSAKVADQTKPHPRSFGTFGRKIGRYALEEKVLSLEAAVRSCSGLPADILGMSDRGYLREGCFADVAVLDPALLMDRATFTEPFVCCSGVRYVLVGGKLAIADGRPADTAAGRPLRHVVAE
ncbi:MAG: D-aminoacylase [Pirellulales bacterium]